MTKLSTSAKVYLAMVLLSCMHLFLLGLLLVQQWWLDE